MSGLRRQTVNLLAFVIAGSNPAFPSQWLDNIMVMYWTANPVMTVQVRL